MKLTGRCWSVNHSGLGRYMPECVCVKESFDSYKESDHRLNIGL